jgi:hypothetical protein
LDEVAIAKKTVGFGVNREDTKIMEYFDINFKRRMTGAERTILNVPLNVVMVARMTGAIDVEQIKAILDRFLNLSMAHLFILMSTRRPLVSLRSATKPRS